jgi:nucleotide-binding universal stress UspA family protein
MRVFHHVLVPTDFSELSSSALDAAVGLARAFDAKLTLLHVWEVPVYPYMDPLLNTELISGIEERAARRLAAGLEQVRQHLPAATSLLKTGMPWAGILEATAETGADLVVMATHGRRGMSHVLMGSTAEKVVRLSKVSVLTVRPPIEA